MMINKENEKLEFKFLDYFKKVKRLSIYAIFKVQKALGYWHKFSGSLDFKNFSEKLALDFKNVLIHEVEKHQRSPENAKQTFNYTFSFFSWLRKQPGYQSCIQRSAVEILKVTR